jgi:hypothetical protein
MKDNNWKDGKPVPQFHQNREGLFYPTRSSTCKAEMLIALNFRALVKLVSQSRIYIDHQKTVTGKDP